MIGQPPVIPITQVGMSTLPMAAGTVSPGLSRPSQMVTVSSSSMSTADWLDHVSLNVMVMPVKSPAMVSSSSAVTVMMAVNSKVISNSLTCMMIQRSPKSLPLIIVASTPNTRSDAIIQSRHLTIVSKPHTNQTTNIFWMNTMMVALVITKITKGMTITDTTPMTMKLMIMISMNTTMMNTAQTKLKLMNQTIMIQQNRPHQTLSPMLVVVEVVHPVHKVHQV